MRYLIVFAMFATACAHEREMKLLNREVAEYGINRFENREIVCFVYRDADTSSMQCFKNK